MLHPPHHEEGVKKKLGRIDVSFKKGMKPFVMIFVYMLGGGFKTTIF